MSDRTTFDICVIGAGIAGASVAAELAADHSVIVLEQESQPGYHTTGRSAALFSTTYGPPVIRALSRASEAFYLAPPEGFTDAPLLASRGALLIAREDQLASLDALESELAGQAGVTRLDAVVARRLLPALRDTYCAGAILEDQARDIDVHALHQGYLRMLKARGGQVATGHAVHAIERTADGWRIACRGRTIEAQTIVNAAGAWADEIAGLAGVAQIGLMPKRRTAAMIAAPDGAVVSGWPMAIDIDEQFYMKPDAGRLLISPADETPSPPCDAQPDEYDIAVAVDRIETAFDIEVRRIENRWTGLRSFVADKCPVAGWAADAQEFFWLAGQGGYGIQTAPALSRLAASMVRGARMPADIEEFGVDLTALSASRDALNIRN